MRIGNYKDYLKHRNKINCLDGNYKSCSLLGLIKLILRNWKDKAKLPN